MQKKSEKGEKENEVTEKKMLPVRKMHKQDSVGEKKEV